MIKPAHYLCIALCCVFNTTSFAEGLWKQGYVVTTAGDTVRGLIAYKEYGSTPLEFWMKADRHSPMKSYNVDNTKAVCIELKRQHMYFQLFETDIDYSQVSAGWLDNSPEPTLVKRKVFLQLMVQGDKSLYYYNDTTLDKKHYLVEWPAGKATELVNKPYYTDEAQLNISYNQLYKKQLKDLYADCKTIAFTDINNTVFTGGALRSLAQQYNSCNNREAKYQYKAERMTATLGAVAGGTSTHLLTRGSYLYYPTMRPSTDLHVGIFTNLFVPRMQKRLAIVLEGAYSGYEMKAERMRDGYTKMTYLKAYTGIRFQHEAGKVYPFLQGGIGNGFAITAESNPAVAMRKYEVSFYGGGGLRYGRFEAEARYEQGNGYSDYYLLGITSIRWSALMKFYVL